MLSIMLSKTREATRLRAIAINCLGGVKVPVHVDP